MIRQLEQKDLKILKEKWYQEQKGICPILEKEYPFEEFVIDHLHTLVKENPDEETGKGFVRGAIQFQANALEGRILSDFKRLGLEKHIDLITFLRKLAEYLENNRFHTEEDKYIHPNEKPKNPILTKRCYNKLVKAIDGKQKVPPYKDKRGNLTKPLLKLFEKYGLEPEFKKE